MQAWSTAGAADGRRPTRLESPGADRILDQVMRRAAPSPKRKRIRRKPEQAEREILDTAEEFLRDHDFRELTIDEVMAATGMVRSGRLATTVRKQFIIAIVNAESRKADFLGFDWWRA